MKKHLFGAALIACLVCGGAALAQTIDDIQYYDPVTGDPLPGQEPAPGYDTDLSGAIVTVTGVCVEKNDFSSASAHIVSATGGIAVYYGGGTFDGVEGDLVELTGEVGTYRGQIQITGATSGTVLTSGNTVTPLELTVTEVLSDYENVGWLAYVEGEVTLVEASQFYITDGVNTIKVYIDSTTMINIGAVEVGETWGITSPITVDNGDLPGEIELKPRWQADLVENPGGDTVPVITSLQCDNWVPTAVEPVSISATITDNIGVSSATLYYRDSDGETPGAWGAVAMSDQGGDVWAGTIPASHPERLIDYYIEAIDTGAQSALLPGDAPTGFFSIAVGFTKIYDALYAHPDSLSQSGAMNGEIVNIQGIVTAGTSQVGSPTQFIVQEENPNPATGDYGFSGILVYETSALYEYFQGDKVAMGGQISEYFGLSEMLPHNGNAVYLLDYGQDLPPASRVTTRVLSDNSASEIDGDGIMGEAWESVWVRTFNSVVLDTLGFGDYIIADTGAENDSLIVAPLTELSYEGTIDDVLQVTSYMNFSFGRREIVPIADEYILQTGLTAADDTPTVLPAGGFRSVTPNPFNPRANIKFVVNRNNLVQLNVYNIRGQKVKTIVQDRLPANDYEFVWDGTDDAGQGVSSGTYYARLRIGAEVVQVRPMTLLK